MTQQQQEEVNLLKELIADSSISADERMIYEDALSELMQSEKPKASTERKPRTTTERKPRTTTQRKPQVPKQSKSDIESAKAEIKRRTGKTEEECESIVNEYRSLRAKSVERKKKETIASADNKDRVAKLKKDDKIISGTNEKTADAVIKTTTKDVAEKIVKEIDKIEQKAEVEATKEVKKEMPKESTTEQNKAIAEKTEEKVKAQTKTIVKRIVIDTSSLLSSIAESLGKFDKDSQKEFLIKLRSDIDKLLTKYSYGGSTMGATQGFNITQSNMSSSSVNPTMFGGGGGVGKLPSNLQNRLNTANRLLVMSGGRELTTEEAIRWNIDNNSESGFVSGQKAIYLVDGDESNIKQKDYYIIGDALIDISEKMTGITYDLYDFEIEKYLQGKGDKQTENQKETALIYSQNNKFVDGGGGVGDFSEEVGKDLIQNYDMSASDVSNLLMDYYDEIKDMQRSGKNSSEVADNIAKLDGESYLEKEYDDDEYKRGGGVRIGSDGREYPFGSAWALEHNSNNKNEDYEIPLSSRKTKRFDEGGGVGDDENFEYWIYQNYPTFDIDTFHLQEFLEEHYENSLTYNENFKNLQEWLEDDYEESNDRFNNGGGVEKGYMVFNYTDNLYASNNVFATKKEANDFIKQFKKRFEQQGYYRDSNMNKIDVEDIDLEIIPSDFNPFRKFNGGGGVGNTARTYDGINSLRSYQKNNIEEIQEYIADNGTIIELVAMNDRDSSSGMTFAVTINGRGIYANRYREDAKEFYKDEIAKYKNNYKFNDGGSVGMKYQVIDKRGSNFNEIGTAINGIEVDKMGKSFVTLHFRNGVNTYSMNQVNPTFNGGGVGMTDSPKRKFIGQMTDRESFAVNEGYDRDEIVNADRNYADDYIGSNEG